MARRAKDDILAIAFVCASTINVGDRVMVSDENTVAVADGTKAAIGSVAVHREDALKCTVETIFREKRDDRVADGAIAAGNWLVDSAPGKVAAYSAGSYASISGDDAGPVTIVTDTSDKIAVAVNGGADQVFTLDAGSTTIAEVAAALNATAVGFTASVDGDGYLKLTANNIGEALKLSAVSNDAYTLLGLTAATVYGSLPSHDPSRIIGVAVTDAADTETLTTLEY